MPVIDTRGQTVGRVVAVEAEHFVVERAASETSELSYDRVRSILGDQVVLDTGPELDRGV